MNFLRNTNFSRKLEKEATLQFTNARKKKQDSFSQSKWPDSEIKKPSSTHKDSLNWTKRYQTVALSSFTNWLLTKKKWPHTMSRNIVASKTSRNNWFQGPKEVFLKFKLWESQKKFFQLSNIYIPTISATVISSLTTFFTTSKMEISNLSTWNAQNLKNRMNLFFRCGQKLVP